MKVRSKKNQKKWLIATGIILFFVVALQSSSTINSQTMDEIMRTSYLGTRNERGIRNNNPLNLKYSPRDYFGKIPLEINTDKVHEQFESLVYGIAAAIQHMRRRYISGSGWDIKNCATPPVRYSAPFDTVRLIANVWAPRGCDPSVTLPGGNNPDEYIAFLVRKTGINPDAKLDPSDKETLKKLIWAMSIFENGAKYEANILSAANWDIFFNVAWNIV